MHEGFMMLWLFSLRQPFEVLSIHCLDRYDNVYIVQGQGMYAILQTIDDDDVYLTHTQSRPESDIQ